MGQHTGAKHTKPMRRGSTGAQEEGDTRRRNSLQRSHQTKRNRDHLAWRVYHRTGFNRQVGAAFCVQLPLQFWTVSATTLLTPGVERADSCSHTYPHLGRWADWRLPDNPPFPRTSCVLATSAHDERIY